MTELTSEQEDIMLEAGRERDAELREARADAIMHDEDTEFEE